MKQSVMMPDVLGWVRELLDPQEERVAGASMLDTLERRTRRQLLDCARRLGLTGIYRLRKEDLVGRLREVLQGLGIGGETPQSEGGPLDLPHKFDLGLPPETTPLPAHIPWGYGRDRVTAMVVDPERLYVYWEVTDESIARTSRDLGPAGEGAWLDLRVYDVTGRLFDGTNAHSYFDHRVERGDRQWFFHLGRPGSAAVIEVGMKSVEGYFVRIARSGRIDFPRTTPAERDDVEWLTVWSAGDQAGVPVAAGPPPGAPPAAPAPVAAAGHDREPAPPSDGDHGARTEVTDGEWRQILPADWVESGSWSWEGPVVHSTWEAGPFPYAIEPPVYVEERYEGDVSVYSRGGRTHVVHGPWQAVIRGLGAHAERRVLAVWEMYRTWTANGHVMQEGAPVTFAGASEAARGASERRWGAGSELRLLGGSEVYRLGASERRLGGASEKLVGGASERRLAGASERRLAGASERRLGGASEWRARGDSEVRLGGASERARSGSVSARTRRG
jgi:Domain of unknown function (DUF4912)